LQRFDAGHFKTINAVDNDLLRGISAIIETANGDLLLNGLSRIFHVPKEELDQALANPSYRIKGEHIGRRNGLSGFAAQIRPLPSAIEGSDGRLWFATAASVACLDPKNSARRVSAPPVTIESVSANDKSYSPAPDLQFPTRTSDVQISYAGVRLSEPEAIHFRYKLDETDRE